MDTYVPTTSSSIEEIADNTRDTVGLAQNSDLELLVVVVLGGCWWLLVVDLKFQYQKYFFTVIIYFIHFWQQH